MFSDAERRRNAFATILMLVALALAGLIFQAGRQFGAKEGALKERMDQDDPVLFGGIETAP